MKKTIRDYNLYNKRVIIRCDFNVPIKDGNIIDDTRIVESLPTIKYALDKDAKVILLSHLGRVKCEDDLIKNDLRPVAERLSLLLDRPVKFITSTSGGDVDCAVLNMNVGDVILLQNTRYEDLDGKKESGNDLQLGKYWASLGDIFINDAFGAAHRAHASNVGIASCIPSGIGFLIEKELNELAKLDNPNHPFVVILGGSKISDKIGVIKSLVLKADYIIIGGGMAFTFLKALGYNVGSSIVDLDNVEFALDIYNKYSDKFILPIDVVVSDSLSDDSKYFEVDINNINSKMGLDIGSGTILKIKNVLKDAGVVFWNGPLGAYEYSNYARGTKEVLEYLVNSHKAVILGGGDIVAAAAKFGYKDKVMHASTGGGATLEYIEGVSLPGIAVIDNL